MAHVNNNIMHEIITDILIIVLNGSRENTAWFMLLYKYQQCLGNLYVCHSEMTIEKSQFF